MRPSSRLLLALTLVGVLVLAGCAHTDKIQVSTAAPQPHTIAVSGHGTANGKPDQMTIQLGVQTTGPSAQTALTQNNTRAAALIAVLKKGGVADKDITTTELSLSSTTDTAGHPTGYQASDMVSAKLLDLTKAGTLIDAAAAVTGNDIRLDGITFSVDDATTATLLATARANAVKDALAQAAQLAAASGVHVGAVRSIDDTATQTTPQPYLSYNAAAAAAPTPIQPGTQQLSADVSVVVDIA